MINVSVNRDINLLKTTVFLEIGLVSKNSEVPSFSSLEMIVAPVDAV
jgi:hypothetical protein